MKKLQLLFCAVALIMISCTLSNEEKAEKLIQESLKGTLYHPESYKSISTQCVTLPISVRSFCLIRASIFVGFIVAFITLSFNGWILWGMGNRTPTQKPLPRVSFHTVRPSLDAFRAVTLDFLLSGDILVFTDKVKEHDKLAA